MALKAVEPLDDEELPDDEAGEALSAPAIVTDEHPADKLLRWSDPTSQVNICDELMEDSAGEAMVAAVGQTVVRQHDIDQQSRSEWVSQSKDAMDLAMQVAKEKSSPWPNSSNVVYPILSTSAIQFAARAYPAMVSGRDVVKGVVYGDDKGQEVMHPETGKVMKGRDGRPLMFGAGEKRKLADRIAEHMSWQLLEEMSEWDEETDKLLHILPIVGCCFRKTFFDAEFRRPSSVLITADNLVINYWAKSMETAPRITEEFRLYPGELQERIMAGVFLEHEFGPAPNNDGDEDAPHEMLEQHRLLDLDGDGYAEPYIVTVHKATQKVVRIASRYDEEGIEVSASSRKIAKVCPVHYYTKYDFLPNPRGGIYGIGFGQLLRPLNDSVNTAINQLFDAGTLQNTGGGFIGRGLSMQTGAVRRKLGEWTVVNAPGSKIRESIVPLQHQGPSDTVFKLLGFLTEAAKELGSNTEALSGNQRGSNVPATTTLALIEQGMKVFTGVYKRLYRSNGKEFDKLFRLNRLYLDKVSKYRRGEEWKEITQADYETSSTVQPVSDPSMVSDMQKLARAQFLKEFANDPFVNKKELRRRILAAASIEDVDELLNEELPPDPALLLKTEELKIKEITARARALADMTVAIKNLADAGSVGAATEFRWIEMQMDALKADVEEMTNAGSKQPGATESPAAALAGAGGPQGGDGSGLQQLEAQPGNSSLSAVSAG